MSPLTPISRLNDAIEAGELTCAEVVAAAIERANDPSGEGARSFVARCADAEEEAQAQDVLRRCRGAASPLAGLPISIKDNIDIAGTPTPAGSTVLRSQPAAIHDAEVVRRLRSAGAVVVGRTNMSEFAFSGVGANPHYGTPLNPFERTLQRIPGGSTSGGVVSVTDGMSVAAIGTDTGGSVRIPAALCGLAGFKPTQARVSREGVFPLSRVLDCVGVIAACVEDCRIVDEILAGQPNFSPSPDPKGIRLCVLPGPLTEGCDRIVEASFERAVEALRQSGISISSETTGLFNIIGGMSARGTYPAAESWEALGHLLDTQADQFDQTIVDRIERGRSISAADLIRNNRDRSAIMATIDAILENYDCVISPTVPIIAPLLSEIAEPEGFHRINQLLLRNPSVANLLDLPSISLPCSAPGAAPVGLMLMGARQRDGRLLAIAAAVERVLRQSWA
jgi:aspartyl-tRNA(Asn)/glutamyl-tRNA(Gln) amidotransferase subunit A